MNRREIAGNKKICTIKAGFPDVPEKIYWSEYVFSNTMKKYLEKLGYDVVIESRDEYDEEKESDIVISLRGPAAYKPDRSKKDRIYIMWNLSHVDTVTDEEYNAFDLVCVGSEKEKYLNQLRERLSVPVVCVPMCVDTELFYPDPNPEADKQYEYIFVGNSRYMKRKCVMWAVENNYPLKIWGKSWEGIIENSHKYVVANNIPNHELQSLYWDAMVTVNDHFDDMLANGFISTRIVEALACGLPVISDYSEVFEQQFGDAVLCYRSEEEYLRQLERVRTDYKRIKASAMAMWSVIQEKYSFEACMNRIAELGEALYKQQVNGGNVQGMSEKEKYSKDVIQKENICLPEGANCTSKDKNLEIEFPCAAKIRKEIAQRRQTGKEWTERRGNNQEKVKVSVIMPVYNMENYLSESMDSIVNQTLREIEIICINDASTDTSLQILLAYAEKDERIHVYSQEHGGLSVARNHGLKNAVGEYVYFMDSDDILEPDALETLYTRSIEQSLDVLYFDAQTMYESEEIKKEQPQFEGYYLRKENYPAACSGQEMFALMNQHREYRVNIGIQFYRRAFLVEQNFLFEPYITHEDNGFTFAAMLSAQRAGYVGNAFLNRRIRKASIMTGRKGFAHAYGYFRSYVGMLAFLQNYHCPEWILDEVYDCLYRTLNNAKKQYQQLPREEQYSYLGLEGAEQITFLLYMRADNEYYVRMQKAFMEKSELNRKLKVTYEEKSELNRKLKTAYDEKSELNQKLKRTYDEKYERGLEIKELKKENAALRESDKRRVSLEKELTLIKQSKSYKLGRMIGYPMRVLKRIWKKINK